MTLLSMRMWWEACGNRDTMIFCLCRGGDKSGFRKRGLFGMEDGFDCYVSQLCRTDLELGCLRWNGSVS